MEIKINKSTIEQTTRCQKDFQCLNAKEGHSLCPAKWSVESYDRFFECNERERCSYMASPGLARICTCPVRQEIHDRYGI